MKPKWHHVMALGMIEGNAVSLDPQSEGVLVSWPPLPRVGSAWLGVCISGTTRGPHVRVLGAANLWLANLLSPCPHERRAVCGSGTRRTAVIPPVVAPAREKRCCTITQASTITCRLRKSLLAPLLPTGRLRGCLRTSCPLTTTSPPLRACPAPRLSLTPLLWGGRLSGPTSRYRIASGVPEPPGIPAHWGREPWVLVRCRNTQPGKL